MLPIVICDYTVSFNFLQKSYPSAMGAQPPWMQGAMVPPPPAFQGQAPMAGAPYMPLAGQF